MPISAIADNEVGSSVRSKLNSVITRVNEGLVNTFTALTGGGAALDGFVTVGVAVGVRAIAHVSGVPETIHIYTLVAGTDAESSPHVIRPDDYAGGTNEKVWKLDIIVCTGLSVADGGNISVGSTTGSKIGTATTQKLGFWNATPIVQPATGGAASTFVANTSAIANDTATWDGYTIGQVVKALRNAGILA